jgi:ribosome recycling factor
MDDKGKILDAMKTMGTKAVDAFHRELARLRTGRANISIFDDIRVDYYGTLTPLAQMATLAVPESRLITIQPWDITQMQAVEKAILASDLGLNPVNDGKIIRIQIPQLTEERRKELVKVAKRYAEECKVSVRNSRRDANDALKKLEKDKAISEDELKKILHDVQNLTDKEVAKVDEIFAKKEKEIVEV